MEGQKAEDTISRNESSTKRDGVELSTIGPQTIVYKEKELGIDWETVISRTLIRGTGYHFILRSRDLSGSESTPEDSQDASLTDTPDNRKKGDMREQ